MSTPSFRLRALTRTMRYIIKPKLRRTATPAKANRDFERAAPFIFSKPKGTCVEDAGPFARVTFGEPDPNRAILYLHGGAFLTGSRRSYAAMAGRLAKRTGVAVYLADYPNLQDAPFPAAPDAALAAWDSLIATGFSPDQIVIAGDSAGGNLVFGLLAQLLGGGGRPAGTVAFSPWGDLTLSGETIAMNAAAEPLIPVSRMQEAVELYLNGADPRDPRASPIYADYPAPPPVLVQVGADEVLLSDAKRLADLTNAQLEIWPHVPHAWQVFDGRLPEANAAMGQAAKFIQTSFDKASR